MRTAALLNRAPYLFCIVAAGAAAPYTLAAELVPVRFGIVAKSATPEIDGTLKLAPVMGPAAPLSIPCCAGDMTVALPANSAWELQPQIHGAWAAKEIVTVGDHPVVHQLKIWPVAHLHGRIQLETNAEVPRALAVDLLDVPARKSGLPPGNSAACVLEADRKFRCDVPALQLDLRFVAGGHVPVQLWDVDLRTGGTRDVGAIFLRKGASVSGWIENGGGVATVTLSPPVAAGGATAERIARPVAKTTARENGFFQLAAVPPGQYVLRVERPGYASEAVAPLRVYGGAETKIRKPIVLRRPVDVTLSVTPPADWRGEPWGVWIAKASPLSGGFDAAPLSHGRTENGRVFLRGRSAGRYSVDVFDSAENPLKNEQFEIDGTADAAHEIRVDVIRIAGTVSIGNAPLETTLWFGGRHGVPHAVVHSDGNGKFRGVLPHDGEWRITAVVDGEDVETTATIRAHDETPNVEIRLPDNRLGGVVVDDKGRPVAAADVTLVTPRLSTTRRSAADGSFLFRCLDEGEISLSASIGSEEKLLASEAVLMKISADAVPPPVQLVVQEGQRLTGTVQSIHGAIAGAAVTAVPAAQTAVATAATDLEGHFKVFLPADADRAYVTVRTPGHALRVFDVPLPNHAVGLNVPLGGGTLDLVFPKGSVRNAALVLFQDERPLPLPEVAHWAMSHGTPPSDAGIHAAEMAPAQYKACIGFRQFVRSQELPRWIASARCVTGVLAPFGTLRLEIPSPNE